MQKRGSFVLLSVKMLFLGYIMDIFQNFIVSCAMSEGIKLPVLLMLSDNFLMNIRGEFERCEKIYLLLRHAERSALAKE